MSRPIHENDSTMLFAESLEPGKYKCQLVKKNLSDEDIDYAFDELLETFLSTEITPLMIYNFWSIKFIATSWWIENKPGDVAKRWSSNFLKKEI